jgi:NAD(P)-dependent dehydrogenase (short-subunit alcohol dehydrogenase family)
VATQNFIESIGYESEHKDMANTQLRIPLGRIGTDPDTRAAVVFLASPAASWMTSCELPAA